MKLDAKAWTLTALLAPAGSAQGGQMPQELCWVPPEAVLVASFDLDADASGELISHLRNALLFALDHQAAFEPLRDVVGPELDAIVSRVLLATVQGEQVARRIGFMTGASIPETFRVLASSPRVERTRLNRREILLLPPDRPNEPESSALRLDDETLVFGSVLGVLEVADRFEAGACEQHEKLVAFFEATDASRPVWAMALRDWLDLGFDAPTLRSADVLGRSFSRSSSRLEGVAISTDFSRDEVRLALRTKAHDSGDAEILLDELGTFVASARRSTPEPLRSSLNRSRVSRDGSDVIFTLPLDVGALSTLRRSQAGRNLIRWRLGAEERERTARISSVLDALAIGAGSRVADVGAGGGFFTVRLARAVGPAGRVYAVDVDESVVEALGSRVERAELGNVEAVVGAPDDPRLPRESLDAVLIVNAYHEMEASVSMLSHIRQSLVDDGRLVLVEPFDPETRAAPRESQVERHEIAPEIVEAELRAQGFEIVERIDALITHEGSSRQDSLVIARRAR